MGQSGGGACTWRWWVTCAHACTFIETAGTCSPRANISTWANKPAPAPTDRPTNSHRSDKPISQSELWCAHTRTTFKQNRSSARGENRLLWGLTLWTPPPVQPPRRARCSSSKPKAFLVLTLFCNKNNKIPVNNIVRNRLDWTRERCVQRKQRATR